VSLITVVFAMLVVRTSPKRRHRFILGRKLGTRKNPHV